MINLDKRPAAQPLYFQLYEQIKQQILSGMLKTGQKLPATRSLADEYGLSRNTVINAYNQLEIEGFIRSRQGSGYYIEDITPFAPPKRSNDKTPSIRIKPAEKYDYSFTYGDLDYSCYRSKKWLRCLSDAADHIAYGKYISYSDPNGSIKLREALCRFLSASRGVSCTPEQIIITSGHKQSIRILLAILKNRYPDFLIEDPGYPVTALLAKEAGMNIVPAPVEADGISLNAVRKAKHALVCVTPSHQFPMGSVLSISKRYNLLTLAQKNDLYIIEDDYDSELRYHDHPIPSMQSIDQAGRTIYLGTFSKSLSPDLRTAYIVLPASLMTAFYDSFTLSSCMVPELIQLAIAEYINEGYYQQHLNTIRTYYMKKHDFIRSYVRHHLSGRASLIGEGAGLHFILDIHTEKPREELADAFEKASIKVIFTDQCWIRKEMASSNQIFLGYGQIPLPKLEPAMNRLASVIG